MNVNWNLDIAIFIVFLALNLIVGLSYGRQVKTIQDYALGGRNFSTAALVSTIVATMASGSGFFILLSNTYSDGLYYLVPNLSMALSLLIIAYLLVPRMNEFLGCTSVAEAMGNMYGKEVRFMTAVCGILFNIGGIAVQFKVFGNVFNYFLGIDATYSIFIASAIVIIYSSFGGIRAVTYTDILQFLTFGFVIPLIGVIIWNQLYHQDLSFTAILETPEFNYKEVFNIDNPKFWGMIPLLLYFAIPSTDPASFQRIAMAHDINQIKKAWVISAILLILIKLACGWIPFLMKVINPDIQQGQLINYIADNYAFPGLKGLMIIGVAALAMSTADSRINSAAVLFANDIGKMLKIPIKELLLSKLFSLSLGAFSVFMALSQADLLSIVMTSSSFYMVTVTVPLFFAIFGFRSSKLPVLFTMGIGFVIVIAGQFLGIKSDNVIIFGMLVNVVTFLGSHYLFKQEGGWIKVLKVDYSKQNMRPSIWFTITNFNFIAFCKKNSPKSELTYMGFGIYCILYTLTTMYSTHSSLLEENGSIILTIYQIMMITGVLMAMYPIWPPRIKHKIIVQVAWNVVVFYMLIFFSGFFVMVSDFNQLQFAVFTLNIAMTALLVGWKLALVMSVTGFYLCSVFYRYHTGIDSVDFSIGSPQFVLMYILMLAGSALIIFLKPKEEQHIITVEKNAHLKGWLYLQESEIKEALSIKSDFVRNMSHKYRAPMAGITCTTQALKQCYYQMTDEQRLEAIDIILRSSAQLDILDVNVSTLAKLANGDYHLKFENLNLTRLVDERVRTCRQLYEEKPESHRFILNLEKNIRVSADRDYLSQVIDNLVINALSYADGGKIEITLKKKADVIEFTIEDEGIGIPQDELDEIFVDLSVSLKSKTRGIGLALCRRIISIHKGAIIAESNGAKGARFVFTLPASS